MAEITQLPGTLDVKLVPGDQLKIYLDFDKNLTGYGITNSIFVERLYTSTGGGSGFVTGLGQTVTTFDMTVTAATAGQVLLDLPENKSSLLSPEISYRWYLKWADTGTVTRTVLSGSLQAVTP